MAEYLTGKMSLQKLTLVGLLVALGVVAAPFSIPVGAAKVFPAQHAINVIAGVLLGPWWGVVAAILTSTLRNLVGWGTLLAFPGSIFGAFLAGLFYLMFKRKEGAALGELLGTGVIGALAAFPVARWFLGSPALAYTFIVPFTLSSAAGVVMALILLALLEKTGYIKLLNAK
jgi:energy coupling factor transporter S component ThiW